MSAAAVGFLGGKYWKEKFFITSGHGSGKGMQRSVLDDEAKCPSRRSPRSLGPCGSVSFACCSGGFRSSYAVFGKDGMAFCFERAVFQQGSRGHIWRCLCGPAIRRATSCRASRMADQPQMMDGLGMAETTPGPLIMVTQFVGFLGGME